MEVQNDISQFWTNINDGNINYVDIAGHCALVALLAATIIVGFKVIVLYVNAFRCKYWPFYYTTTLFI